MTEQALQWHQVPIPGAEYRECICCCGDGRHIRKHRLTLFTLNGLEAEVGRLRAENEGLRVALRASRPSPI